MFCTVIDYLWKGLGVVWMFGLFRLDTLHMDAFFPGSVQYNRIIYADLFDGNHNPNKEPSENNKSIANYCKQIKDWALKGQRDEKQSHHIWYRDLPELLKHAFEYIDSHIAISNGFRQVFCTEEYDRISLDGMNEVYVTGDSRKKDGWNSDHVFFMSHVDGPYFYLPFVSVYRVLVGLNKNNDISTVFPMCDKKYTLDYGDALGFDFDRQVHYIKKEENTSPRKEPRATMKLHYCIYPKGWHWYGRFVGDLHVQYNKKFRELFLHTINPTSWYERMYGTIVVGTTQLVVWTDIYIGFRNLFYMVLMNSILPLDAVMDRFMCISGFAVFWKTSYLYYLNEKQLLDLEGYSDLRDTILFSSIHLSIVWIRWMNLI
jgi:hypothetical protein